MSQKKTTEEDDLTPFQKTITNHMRAVFTCIWVNTLEHTDAIKELISLRQIYGWQLARWDCDRGMRVFVPTDPQLWVTPEIAARANPQCITHNTLTNRNGPVEAAQAGGVWWDEKNKDSSEGPAMHILVLLNFHKFLGNSQVLQALHNSMEAGRDHRTVMVILSGVPQIPLEIEKEVVLLDYNLPDKEQLRTIATSICDDSMEEEREAIQTGERESSLEAALGMTRIEAEGAFSLAVIEHKKLDTPTIWNLKTQTIAKSGLLQIHKGTETFEDIGGLAYLKEFCRKSLELRERRIAQARGVLLLGVPGTGKSMFAKALGTETGRPTIMLDIGSLMGSLVGQTEAQTRHALKQVDAMAPALLFID